MLAESEKECICWFWVVAAQREKATHGTQDAGDGSCQTARTVLRSVAVFLWR